jgi:hypothetical protein
MQEHLNIFSITILSPVVEISKPQPTVASQRACSVCLSPTDSAVTRVWVTNTCTPVNALCIYDTYSNEMVPKLWYNYQ